MKPVAYLSLAAVLAAICVGALARICLISCDRREVADTATLTAPVATGTAARVDNNDRPPLPKSRAEIIAALGVRGFELQQQEGPSPIEGATGYRVQGLPAALAFHERDGVLAAVEAMVAAPAGDKANGSLALDFAEIVGEISTGRSREICCQVIAQTMNAIGRQPGRMSASFGVEKNCFRLGTVRHSDGGYSFAFSVEP